MLEDGTMESWRFFPCMAAISDGGLNSEGTDDDRTIVLIGRNMFQSCQANDGR